MHIYICIKYDVHCNLYCYFYNFVCTYASRAEVYFLCERYNYYYLGVLPMDTRLHACRHTRTRVHLYTCSVFITYKWAKCQSKRTFTAKNSILQANIMEVDGTARPNANNCLGMYTWI